MKMVFHRPDSKFRHKNTMVHEKNSVFIPNYTSSSVLLGWFAGKEALELQSLDDETIIEGVSTLYQVSS